MCIKGSTTTVKVRNNVTGSFAIYNGLRQGGGFSPTLLNIEKAVRDAKVTTETMRASVRGWCGPYIEVSNRY